MVRHFGLYMGMRGDKDVVRAAEIYEQRRMVAPEWALVEAERAKSEEDRLAAAFWNSLGDAQACSEHVQLVQDRPSCDYSRGTVQGERRRSLVKQVKQCRDRKCFSLTCYRFGCNGEH